MARLLLCVLALLAVSGVSAARKVAKPADPVLLQRQLNIFWLFYHIHEPLQIQEAISIASSYNIEKNIEQYSNVTSVKIYSSLLEVGVLPRGVPFAYLNPVHNEEAVALYNLLISAKDWDTFYKTAVHLRDRVNENLYVYVLSVVLFHRQDTQGIVVPPIYEIFPSYFNNAEIMNTAQRINTHGLKFVDHYLSTYVWDNNVVIRWNETAWPYYQVDDPVAYYTHDYGLNALYYNYYLTYPPWLGGEVYPLGKDRRGEWFFFSHKQILARYYMERLSNGLGEIPELGSFVVEEGYEPGLSYSNGIPFPVRPYNYHLNHPSISSVLENIYGWERKIQEAIECGYVVNVAGERVSIREPEAIDILGNLIEANVDSINPQCHKDFISAWKYLLGSAVVKGQRYYNNNQPLVRPSVLELYQTALRDPAFYMIWKRVMKLFELWQQQLPPYKPEELALPSVVIQDVEIDKLVTYFELSYMNVSNHLYMNDYESKTLTNDVSVLVQRPRLNHKVFKVRVNIKSDVSQTVVIRFFLAPKYDSKGEEIPLHVNTENFFLLDQFTHDLPQGDCEVRRESNKNIYTVPDWISGHEQFLKVENALHGHGQYIVDVDSIEGFPRRLILPKGRVGGMNFVFLIHISKYNPPKVPYGTGYDPAVSLGLGSGARVMTSDPLGFPLDRPLHKWQIQGLHNIRIHDVVINHKLAPEVFVHHKE